MEVGYNFDRENKVWIKRGYINNVVYSDGAAVEQQIYEAVKKCKDISVLSEELETHITNWTSQYFFSKKRANLLRPFAALFKGKHILEPGCGAGSITRFLGECGAYVYALEPNLRRARIAAERCRDLENVTVICDDIGSFESSKKFDGIIQVGVLEYATRYSTDNNATLNFLLHLKSYLKDDGFLITAIENQLGLKYFSGFVEDHAGVMMHNINNNYQPGEATTMGRKKLTDTFENAGFAQNDFFLPFPDYKMPSLVFYPGFNEKNNATNINIESILSNISYQDTQEYTPLFSLDKALPLIAQNDLLYDLSNSFCIFSQCQPHHKAADDILFAFYRTERRKEYCKETLFKLEGDAVKVVCNYLADVPATAGQENIISFDAEEPAFDGVLHHYGLVEIVNRASWNIEQVGNWLNTWFGCLKTELMQMHGLKERKFARLDSTINGKYIDAIPINLIMQPNGFKFIDLEINLNQDVELGYIIFRAVHVSLSRLSSVAPPEEPEYSDVEHILYSLFAYLGYTLTAETLDRYYVYEANLAQDVAALPVTTMKGAVSKLRVRPYMSHLQDSLRRIELLEKHCKTLENQVELLEEQLGQQNDDPIVNLYRKLYTRSSRRKKMLKQLIKKTVSFLHLMA